MEANEEVVPRFKRLREEEEAAAKVTRIRGVTPDASTYYPRGESAQSDAATQYMNPREGSVGVADAATQDTNPREGAVGVAESETSEDSDDAMEEGEREIWRDRTIGISLADSIKSKLEELKSNSGVNYGHEYNYEIFEDLEYHLELDYIYYIDLPLEELLEEEREEELNELLYSLKRGGGKRKAKKKKESWRGMRYNMCYCIGGLS